MDNKEFLEILKTAKAMNWEPNLEHYLDSVIKYLRSETVLEETWLDRLIAATDEGENLTDDSGTPLLCLGKILGYGGCLDTPRNCLECWKTPVSEIGITEGVMKA